MHDVVTVTNTPFKQVNIFGFVLALSAKSGIANDFLTPGPVLCSLGSDELYKLSCRLRQNLLCCTAGTQECHC